MNGTPQLVMVELPINVSLPDGKLVSLNTTSVDACAVGNAFFS